MLLKKDINVEKSNNTKIFAVRIITVFFMVLLLFSAFTCVQPVHAYDEVNDISVTVGYWAGKDYTKKKVSLSELASACGTHRQIYTWINSGNAPGTTEAEGIYISDIMNYSGVDMNSVYYYNFYTVDAGSYGHANEQWTQSQLFGIRYSCINSFRKVLKDYNEDTTDFIENPERHYTVEDIFDFSENRYTSDAWNNRVEVQPMLALRTKSSKWSGYAPASNLDYSGMTSGGKPILVFGQAVRNEMTRHLQAQMVSKIHIWFEGSPSITLEAQDLKGKVGSKKKIKVKVNTPDEFLTKKVAEEVVLSSSNTKAATVSKDGTVTIKGEGSADITATYDGKVYGTVTATGEKGESDDPGEDDQDDKPDDDQEQDDDDDNGNGSGTGTSDGDGDGSSTGANTGDGNSTGKANTHIGPTGSNNSILKSAGGAASGSGDNNEKFYEISTSDKELKESLKGSRFFMWIIIIAAGAVLAGIIGQSVYYRDQTNWIKRAKRTYEQL